MSWIFATGIGGHIAAQAERDKSLTPEERRMRYASVSAQARRRQRVSKFAQKEELTRDKTYKDLAESAEDQRIQDAFLSTLNPFKPL